MSTVPCVVSSLVAGFPRTITQAKELDEAQQISTVLNLAVPFATIRERIEVCGCRSCAMTFVQCFFPVMSFSFSFGPPLNLVLQIVKATIHCV